MKLFSYISIAAIVFLMLGNSAFAQSVAEEDNNQKFVIEMRKELQELREMQISIADRINHIEAQLNRSSLPVPPILIQDEANLSNANVSESKEKITPTDGLNVSGDLRLRYEANFQNNELPFRGREVIRGRLRADYAIDGHNTIGAGIATGSPDDPNTADVTLSNFTDDLLVSLDRLYWRYKSDGIELNAGKFANPFTRTDLVWDGDVNPQGISVAYTSELSEATKLGARTMYYVIDESVLGPESDMLGFQANWSYAPKSNWNFDFNAAYMDYSLKNTASADGGDFRSNLLASNGSYLSDFNLVDIIARLEFTGINDRWPISFTADYVKNLGAATDDDTGYSLDVFTGRKTEPGEYGFSYGYSQAETDAVLAAFSNDNTNLATNYRQHSLSFDYLAAEHILFNTTYYHYRPLHLNPGSVNDWQDRIRLNLIFTY